jgi:hypothetical protein
VAFSVGGLLELAFEEFLEVKEEIEGPEQGPSSVLK